MVYSGGESFAEKPRGENHPEGGETNSVAVAHTCGAFHTEGTAAETLEICEHYAAEHKEEQYLHSVCKKYVSGICGGFGGVVAEEYRMLKREEHRAVVKRCFDMSHNDEQKPSEREAHVHIAQHLVGFKDVVVQKSFAYALPY